MATGSRKTSAPVTAVPAVADPTSRIARRAVGIDPGLNITGYAVVDPVSRGAYVIEAGVIRPPSAGKTLGARLAAHPFAHGARHDIGGLEIFDSYHCSRYNTNTGRLTPAMFEAVFADLRSRLDAPGPVSPASA